MKKILVLHTGGTIAMSEDHQTGAVTTTGLNPLLHQQLQFDEDTQLIIEDFLQLPSPYMTPSYMLLIKDRILTGIDEGITGVVITHGTDTLEETAYFLDVTIGDRIPIVLTGAMRSSNEIGADGLYNYQTAIRVASCDESIGKGTLVVMNDEIHTARYVTKTHTTNVATFRTPTFGPIGLVTKQHITFYQQLIEHHCLNIESVNGTIPIIKAYAGLGDSLFPMILGSNIDGLVIEALGAGNLPPETLPALDHLLEKNIPVVLVSRCFNGVVEGVYDYDGGGRQLEKKGVIFCNGLNSQKARLKLLVGLNAGLDDKQLYDFLVEHV